MSKVVDTSWKEAFQRVFDVYGAEVRDLKKRVERGECPACFASKSLEDPGSAKLGETQRLFALGIVMEAGSDTSRMTLSQTIAAAATDIRWIQKVQEEMDRVCGYAERLPAPSDRKELMYASAVTKEGFRWRPFAEIGGCLFAMWSKNPADLVQYSGVLHMLVEDDVYEGYHFPAEINFHLECVAYVNESR